MAELAISEANLAMTTPLPDGLMTPHIVATFPVAREVAFDAAGVSYAVAELTVVVVAASVYSLLYARIVGEAGPLILHLLPVVVAAEV